MKMFIFWMLLLLTSWFCLVERNHNYFMLWNKNELYITADKSLDLSNIKVEFAMSTHHIAGDYPSQQNAFKEGGSYAVLFDGEQKNGIINEYGENDFLLSYNKQGYLRFRHFKTNRRHQHKYHFHFFTRRNQVFVQVDIQGEDDVSLFEPLNK